ncbi:MAG: group III truncated hemoglobin [Phycisphaerales bacterium JB041]
MPDRDTPTPAARHLPLAKAIERSSAPGRVTEADIRALVDAFYESVRGDSLLGPVFARHVADWSVHLPKMYSFWSTVILRTGRYAGRPIEVHEALPTLTRAHFDRWLGLWEQTVESVLRPEARPAFVLSATRMAASMTARLVG